MTDAAARPSGNLRVGVDSGGTFTDICLLDQDSGEFFVWKVSSTPRDASEGISAGIGQALEKLSSRDGRKHSVSYFGHGTTVATNALIEKRGAEVAVLTTEGVRDLLELARQRRPSLYDLQADKPEPLAARDMRYELRERVLFDGSIETPLREADVRLAARILRERGARAVAVCFLFSFIEPRHEAMVKRILAEELPDAYVSVSHEISAEYREFERLSTVVMNAYVGPVMKSYLGRIAPRLQAIGVDAPPHLTQSNGGVISCAVAAEQPVRTMLSGPAAGITGAVTLGRLAGIGNVITFDMGGTSTDVALVNDGRVAMTNNTVVHGYPLKVPMLDINTVGAGGGSIAHIDDGGLLKVGPRSAGAMPGPVAYGRGNGEPTVTDANIVLGVLNPSHLLGGRMPIDAAAARRAIEALASRLGLDLMQTAAGIIRIVTANMVKAIRVISVERGYDPRDYALMAFGGAGPLHAARLARELDIGRILVPRYPGILCAMGLLLSDLRFDHALTRLMRLETESLEELASVHALLRGRADKAFDEESIEPARRAVTFTVDMRYAGQSHELNVAFPAGLGGAELIASLRRGFEEEHRRMYGYVAEGEAIQITTLRCEAVGRIDQPKLKAAAEARGPASEAVIGSREVFLPEVGGFVACAIYDRERLAPGHRIAGPALVDQMDSTTLLLPGQAATVDPYLNILIEDQRR